MSQCVLISGIIIICWASLSVAEVGVDDTPAATGRWGFRPADGSVSMRTPPSFSWRPQAGAQRYALQIARDEGFADVRYENDGIEFNVHCPPVTLPAGRYCWRFRFVDSKGDTSAWSRVWAFTIAEEAVEFPLPGRAESGVGVMGCRLLLRLPTPSAWQSAAGPRFRLPRPCAVPGKAKPGATR